MPKLRLFATPHQEYCKYKAAAVNNLFDYVEGNCLKNKRYMNGNHDIWFNKGEFKHAKYLINKLDFESIAYDVTGR